MNWVIFWWLVGFFLISTIIVLAKELIDAKEEVRSLVKMLEEERIHNETKVAYADFRADAKIMDFKEEVKQLQMINSQYKKELDRQRDGSGS